MVVTWHRGCRCATSLCDLDLTFYHAVVSLTYKIFTGYISETVWCRKLMLDSSVVNGLLVCGISLRFGRKNEIRKEYFGTGF